MKKFISSLFFFLIFVCFSSLTSFAQEGQIQLGGGLIFGSEVEALGIQVNGTYRFRENIDLAPDISIFFVDEESGIDSFWAINLNGHYIFSTEDEYNIYGLGGINIANIGNSFTDESDTELGLNLGVGGDYYLDSFSLFGELKYVISDFDQLVLGAGVRFPITSEQ